MPRGTDAAPSADATHPHLSYARKFPDGLALTLSLDCEPPSSG